MRIKSIINPLLQDFQPRWWKPWTRCPICRRIWCFGRRSSWGVKPQEGLKKAFYFYSYPPPHSLRDMRAHDCKLDIAGYLDLRRQQQTTDDAIEAGTWAPPDGMPPLAPISAEMLNTWFSLRRASGETDIPDDLPIESAPESPIDAI